MIRKVFWNARYLLPRFMPPWQRWIVTVCYWVFLLAFVAYPFGFIDELQSAVTSSDSGGSSSSSVPIEKSMTHLITFVYMVPIMLVAYNEAYLHTFDRGLSLFSIVVFPLGSFLDTMMWCASFDIGVFVCTKLLGISLLSVQYICGMITMLTFIVCHRITIEQWYTPLHHFPPVEAPEVKRRLVTWILIATGGSFLFGLDWFSNHDLLFLILIRYAFDLHVSIRIRRPDPWQNDDKSNKDVTEWHKVHAASTNISGKDK